jgi:hypothetical protein
MNIKHKYKHQSWFALLLLAVFFSSLISKPVHSFFAQHNHSEGICTSDHEKGITTNHYKDCPVCDFEFCSFIPQKQINIPQATVIVRNEQIVSTVACLASLSSHLFQLRAPPAH